MASVIQTIFSLPPFQQAYFPSASAHWESCTEISSAACLRCQMHKLADGLLSGRYSHPRPAGTSLSDEPKATNPLAHESPAGVAFQDGVRPAGFKALIGKGHAEFATMRQQDAEEFLGFLLESLRRDARRRAGSGNQTQDAPPTEVFRFGLEQRLACGECGGVRYRTDGTDVLSLAVPAQEKGKTEDGKFIWEDVELLECVKAALSVETLEYKCPRCNRNVGAQKGTKLASFPEVLVVHAKKFQLLNWVPSKLGMVVTLIAVVI
jgi:ubiquitin carboxyl-terminal hydrolase 5/13